MNLPLRLLFASGLAMAAAACQTIHPTPPLTQAVQVETLEISEVTSSVSGAQVTHSAYADVTGYLSNAAASMVDPPRQWRKGYRLYIELLEQMPHNAMGATMLVPFERRVPVDLTGLKPGVFIVNVNGKEEHLEIPDSVDQYPGLTPSNPYAAP